MKQIIMLALVFFIGAPFTNVLAASDTTSAQSALSKLPGWSQDAVDEIWPAWLKSCSRLKSDALWLHSCLLAAQIDVSDTVAIRRYFEDNFTAQLLTVADGSSDALVTGYYEPVLAGSLSKDAVYRFPLYALPGDLQKGVLYPARAEIDSGRFTPAANVIAYLKDDLDRFLAHVQGSCKIRLPDGSLISAVYAGKNGHAYSSIGKLLVARGEVSQEKISMQAIREWAKLHPDGLNELLWSNPSYVFFEARPATKDGPPGAMNVGLTARRSVAIDPDRVSFGYPVWLDTTLPDTGAPYQRLMAAQDKGAAIKGLRLDVFFGSGEEAGEIAGKMRQQGRIWVLMPKDKPHPLVDSALGKL